MLTRARLLWLRLRGTVSTLRYFLHRGESEAEMDEEIRFHLDQRTAEYLRAGMEPREARRRALIDFGGVERWKVRNREVGGVLFAENLLQDLRLAVRRLRRRPLVTLGSVATLAFGLGATTATFSLAYAVLYRPLPFPNPQELFHVWDASGVWGLSEPEYHAFRERNRTLLDMGAFTQIQVNAQGVRGPSRIPAALVTPNLFSVIGAAPALGSLFPPDAGGPGGSPVVILSHGLWQQEYGGDPEVLGKTILLNERPFSVVGVMAPSFDFPLYGGVQIWAPLPLDPGNPVGSRRYLRTVARGISHVPLQVVAEDLNRINHDLREEILRRFPDGANVTERIDLVPLREELVGGLKSQSRVLFGSVTLVLILVCVNLSTLLLSEGQNRRRDVAMQLAVGAPRRFIIRGFLMESLLLSLAGCAIGILATLWAARTLLLAAAGIVPVIQTAEVNLPVLLFSIILGVGVSLAVGLVPALRTSSVDPLSEIKGGSRRFSRAGTRARGGLVMAQLAISILIMAGAGSVVKSFHRLKAVDLGFVPEGVLAVRLTPPPTRYGTPTPLLQFYDAVEERVRALPGVREVGFTTLVPLDGLGGSTVFGIEGSGRPWDGTTLAYYQIVTRDFFRAVGAELVEGRSFGEADTEDAPGVVMVNRAAARLYWPNQTPVGKRIQLWPDEPWLTVVGVVADIRMVSPEVEPNPRMYLPRRQSGFVSRVGVWPTMHLVVRTAVEPFSLVDQLQQAVMEVDPLVPLSSVRTLDQIVDNRSAIWRVLSLLVGLFAAVAFVLAAMGVYGVVSCSVGTRTQEFAVRMAMGASRGKVIRLAVLDAGRLILPGLVLGVAGALVAGALLSTILFGVTPVEGGILILAVSLLSAVALLSSVLPARRGVSSEPMRFLERG